jgi:hypothetical protein
VQHSKLRKTSDFFSVFVGMLPEHKILWGISENGRPTPVSILFSKMPQPCFFHDVQQVPTRYPPGITEFSKTKKIMLQLLF